MLAISKETTYSIFILVFLAKNKGSWSLQEIAKRQRLPYKYLSRLVLVLRNAGLVKSYAGRYGGYILAKRPTQITMADILPLFERKKGLIPCLGGKKGKCCSPHCTQKSAWRQLEQKIIKEAAKIRLKDLLFA